jgi:hypothetical protein
MKVYDVILVNIGVYIVISLSELCGLCVQRYLIKGYGFKLIYIFSDDFILPGHVHKDVFFSTCCS